MAHAHSFVKPESTFYVLNINRLSLRGGEFQVSRATANSHRRRFTASAHDDKVLLNLQASNTKAGEITSHVLLSQAYVSCLMQDDEKSSSFCVRIIFIYKRLRCRRGTARLSVSAEISSAAAQLYDN